ncbi:MAG: fmt [Verrucomicrobiaceae bacterium]|nr:fmt [Verrucomicrobiaceae bacterium]
MTNSSPLRIIFAGTPAFAAAHLQALLDWNGGQVIAVYTQPDRPAGRGKQLAASPVKQLALANALPVLQPVSLRNADAQAQLKALGADIMVVVAYGLILPTPVLETPRLGCVNVHASILPRWRGAAPIQRAIEAGDAETGVTIMQMDAGLDTGAMLSIVRCAIDADETAATLHDKLAAIGTPALLATLQALNEQRANPQQQDDALNCYAAKISKDEAIIDWQQPAGVLDRRVRAFNPFPIAYGVLSGERVKFHRAAPGPMISDANPGSIVSAERDGIVVACGDNTSLRILELQWPGGKILSSAEALNGRGDLLKPGARFDAA